MITFKQFFYEKADNFTNTINKLKEQGFIIKDGKIGGDDVVLISPAHMGVEWNKDNLIYRSSIWTTDGEPVSLSFTKFFNWGEKSELVPEPASLKNAIAKGKLDGCLDENTIINTEDGNKTIREICETQYNGKVKTFNLETEEIEYQPILNHFININDKKWFEVELEDGTIIKITGNHMVWLPDLQCYRRVDNLYEGDNILKI